MTTNTITSTERLAMIDRYKALSLVLINTDEDTPKWDAIWDDMQTIKAEIDNATVVDSATFEIGQTYEMHGATIKVVKRTEKMLTFEYEGNVTRRKIQKSDSWEFINLAPYWVITAKK